MTTAARAEDVPHGDAGAGDKVFTECRSRHRVGESAKTLIGPELKCPIRRKAASVSGYDDSDAMKTSGLTWDEHTFRHRIENPKAKVSGTKMAFAGVSKDEDIDDVEAFWARYGDVAPIV